VSQNRHDPDYWRERAEKMRAQAEQTHDARACHVLLAFARSYDLMAKRVALFGEMPPRFGLSRSD
jgi:hypothetical protein